MIAAARQAGCALEINAEPDRLDLDDVQAHTAKAAGVALAISTGDLGGQRAAISINAPIARFTKALGEHWSASLISVVDDLHHDRL